MWAGFIRPLAPEVFSSCYLLPVPTYGTARGNFIFADRISSSAVSYQQRVSFAATRLLERMTAKGQPLFIGALA